MIVALVARIVAQPFQILAALITMMSPLPVVSVQNYFDECYILTNNRRAKFLCQALFYFIKLFDMLVA